MAGHIAYATLKGPSVIREIRIAISLGLITRGMWKMHHWNEQRKVRTSYDLLEKGEISVVEEEKPISSAFSTLFYSNLPSKALKLRKECESG